MKKVKKTTTKKSNKSKVKANNVTIVVNNGKVDSKKTAKKAAKVNKTKELTEKVGLLEKLIADNEIRINELLIKNNGLLEQIEKDSIASKAKYEMKAAEANEIGNKLDIAIQVIDIILTKIDEYWSQLKERPKKRLVRDVIADYEQNIFPKIKTVLINKLDQEFEDDSDVQAEEVDNTVNNDDIAEDGVVEEENEVQAQPTPVEENIDKPITEEQINEEIDNDLNL